MDHYMSATETESCLTDNTDISTAKHSAESQFSAAVFVKRQMFNQCLSKPFWMNVVVNGNAGAVKSQES